MFTEPANEIYMNKVKNLTIIFTQDHGFNYKILIILQCSNMSQRPAVKFILITLKGHVVKRNYIV